MDDAKKKEAVDLKVRENKARRAAARQHLLLHKSPMKDRRGLGFGLWAVQATDGRFVLGGGVQKFTATLAEVEAYLDGEGR